MNELKVFQTLEKRIKDIQSAKNKPVRVAVNGIQGAGKTFFAKNLVDHLNQNNLKAIHIGIDGFHNNKQYRYRQGRDSAKGYYEDAYNETAFTESVLKSSQADPPFYVTAVYDLETDEDLELEPIELAQESVLVTDGAYVFKPAYRDHWDLKIYLKVDFETAMIRGIQRDLELLGGGDNAREKYLNRYHAASKMYIDEVNPEELADIVIDNTFFKKPKIIR